MKPARLDLLLIVAALAALALIAVYTILLGDGLAGAR